MNLYWIWLSEIMYVGPVLQKALLNTLGCPQKVYEAKEEELAAVPKMNQRALQSILNGKNLAYSLKILRECEKKGIQILRFDDEKYPEHAKVIPKSPAILYYLGRLESITEAVAVVGSRRCTPYGKKVAREIGAQLAELHIPLISGFAKGIDGYAQSSCVENGGYTIAFLAHGVDLCYPKEQLSLYEKLIASGGAILSSFPPGTKARPEYFPHRNALISAWSTEVVIVEAEKKSGALWTTKFGKEQGRRILAVPNQLGVTVGEGTNGLIAEKKAVPYLGIQSLKINRQQEARDKHYETGTCQLNLGASKTQLEILAYLQHGPKSLLELSRSLQKSEDLILEELLSLELIGEVIIRGNMVTRV